MKLKYAEDSLQKRSVERKQAITNTNKQAKASSNIGPLTCIEFCTRSNRRKRGQTLTSDGAIQ